MLERQCISLFVRGAHVAQNLLLPYSTPSATVPLDIFDNGEPFGLTFLGRKWSESTLISLM